MKYTCYHPCVKISYALGVEKQLIPVDQVDTRYHLNGKIYETAISSAGANKIPAECPRPSFSKSLQYSFNFSNEPL